MNCLIIPYVSINLFRYFTRLYFWRIYSLSGKVEWGYISNRKSEKGEKLILSRLGWLYRLIRLSRLADSFHCFNFLHHKQASSTMGRWKGCLYLQWSLFIHILRRANGRLDSIVLSLIDGHGNQLISLDLQNLTHLYFDSFLVS